MDQVAGVINKLLIATPFVVVTSLGLHASNIFQPFRYVADSATRDREISNYIPVVRATEGALGDKFALGETAATKLANSWILGAASGALRPLAPIAIDDTSRDGVKSQIIRDCSVVGESLNAAAQDHLRDKQYSEAVQDALKSAQTMQTVKYFDFASIATTSMVQRRSLQIVSDALPHLSLNERTTVKHQVDQLAVPATTLKELTFVMRVFAVQRSDAPASLGSYLSLTQDPKNRDLFRLTADAPQVPQEDAPLTDLLNDYRLGLSAAIDSNRVVKQLAK